MSGLSLVGRPVVGFSCCVPAPSVECVVDQHSRFKLFEIVIVHAGQPEGRRQQARRFRREFSRPVSAARTMIARRSRGGVERPNSSIMTSNVHSSPQQRCCHGSAAEKSKRNCDIAVCSSEQSTHNDDSVDDHHSARGHNRKIEGKQSPQAWCRKIDANAARGVVVDAAPAFRPFSLRDSDG